VDEISGALLDAELVHKARQDELKSIQDFSVHTKVPEAQSHGKTVISVKWCDINWRVHASTNEGPCL